MANPAYTTIVYPAGFTLYTILRRSADGYIWDVGDSAFEAVGTWNDARVDECDIAMTDKGGNFYTVTFPTVAAGNYVIIIFLQAGGSPDTTDAILGSMSISGETGNLTFIKNVIEGDAEIDTGGSPYQLVIKIKGTATELIRKDLNDIDGNDIITEAVVIGQHKEP